MTLKQVFRIYFMWLIFPLAFACWHLDLRIHGLSDGLAEDYLLWNEYEHHDLIK